MWDIRPGAFASYQPAKNKERVVPGNDTTGACRFSEGVDSSRKRNPNLEGHQTRFSFKLIADATRKMLRSGKSERSMGATGELQEKRLKIGARI